MPADGNPFLDFTGSCNACAPLRMLSVLSSNRMYERISRDSEDGHWLNFDPEPSETAHQFCGTNDTQGANCPTCFKPLLRILSLSAMDARLHIDPAQTEVIHLFYCWTCSIPYGIFSYRIKQDGTVELLEVPPTWESAFGPEGPYENYTGQFPLRKVGLRPLTEEEEQQQEAAQSDDDLACDLMPQKHQIGGLPVIANPQQIICPVCSKASPYWR
jgi:hypothetical protein